MAHLPRAALRLVAVADAEPDDALLGRFVTGRDGEAFARLLRRHGPMVLAVCRRVLRHRQDAEDAFQATFLVLARRAMAVRPRALLGCWLYGVAYRTALAARRLAAARRVREARAGVMREVEAAPDDPLPPDLREALDRELAALPDVYRAAVVACDLEGLSRKEAAARLGWGEGTLSGRLARARALLARRLSRFGLAIPGGGLVAVVGAEAGACELVEATARIGVLLLAGEAVAAPVAALVEGTMKAMLLTKLKALAAAGVVGCAVLATAAAGWRANAAGAADPPAGGAKPADPKAKAKADLPPPRRDPDKDRIAELERERDALRKELADLKTRLARAEDQQKALSDQVKRALQAETAARDMAERQRDVAMKAALLAETAAQDKARRDADAARAANRFTPPTLPPPPKDELVPTKPGPDTALLVPRPAPAPTKRPDVPTNNQGSTSPPRASATPALVPSLTVSPPNPSVAKPVVRVYAVSELAADEKEGEALVKVVRATVGPRSWAVDAGIEYLALKKVLVVRQTEAGHAGVEELLRRLREVPAPPPAK
jgi:RNA polymerase sigma factor (sigma-70 family)